MQLRLAFRTVGVEKEDEESGASLGRGLAEGRVGVFRILENLIWIEKGRAETGNSCGEVA